MKAERAARVATGLVLSAASMTLAQALPAFPGADGAARTITGGRGGVVYHVTSLAGRHNDPNRAAPGTLIYGLTDANFTVNGVVQPRTIVFDVGGTIDLGSWDTQCRINVGRNVTIAGQTAPGGINIIGGVIKVNGSNSIIRNLTVAPGYGMRGIGADGIPDSYVYDAFDISGQNILIDHCSTFFATDEHISANETANNVTIQYTNISQGQNYPNLDGNYTGHAFGSLFQMGSNARLSVHHNLHAHQKGRLPRVGSSVGTGAINDFRNNVFYNWLGTAGTGGSGQPSFNNFVGNFYLAGPGGEDAAGGSTPAIVNRAGGTGIFNGNNTSGTRVHHAGNLKDINKDGDALDGVALTNSDFGSSTFIGSPYNAGYVGPTQSATAAFDYVLNYVGANWWTRDSVIDTVDERIIHETRTGTGRIIAWADNPNDPSDGAEWLALKNAPMQTRPAGWDSDGDGMPDAWEIRHGLDPLSHNPNGDFDSDGYTDLEEYLNELAAWPAPFAIAFNAGANSRYADILNWDANPDPAVSAPWQPSRFDTAQVNAGTVVVDAIGQDAFVVQIGATSGSGATLRLDDGWLHVRNAINIGAATTSTDAALILAGGKLIVEGQIAGGLGSNARFDLTGGTLVASTIDMTHLGGTLNNAGGTIAPGDSGVAGRTHVVGSVVLTETSDIAIDLGGASSASSFQHASGRFDRLDVTGSVALDGTLSLALLAGYEPQALFSHPVITGSSVVGRFDTIEGVQASTNLWLAVTYDATSVRVTAAVPGDADLSGTVDFADLLALAQSYDADASWASGDFTGDGVAGFEDLLVLAQRYGSGEALSSDWALARSVVPEPASMVAGLASIVLLARRTR